MLLTVDIGNTNIVFGVFHGEVLYTSFRLSTRTNATQDEYACLIVNLLEMSGLNLSQIKHACVSSVVPPVSDVFLEVMRKWHLDPIFVDSKTKTGIKVLYQPPEDVGADRIVNAVAGYNKYKSDLIIVDFGTATTFDAVTSRGEYLGGVIVPGVLVSLEALFHRTAKLPKVDLLKPETVIGRSTTHSIRSGAYYGYLSMVEGLTRRIKSELTPPIKVIATGGLAQYMCSESTEIDEVDPNLTLTGLRLIWEMNHSRVP